MWTDWSVCRSEPVWRSDRTSLMDSRSTTIDNKFYSLFAMLAADWLSRSDCSYCAPSLLHFPGFPYFSRRSKNVSLMATQAQWIAIVTTSSEWSVSSPPNWMLQMYLCNLYLYFYKILCPPLPYFGRVTPCPLWVIRPCPDPTRGSIPWSPLWDFHPPDLL